jgi:hypothetical protein
MSYFASSASPEVALWHDSKPAHLMQEVRENIKTGLGIALEEAQEVIVEAEYNLGQLADELGIKHFGHQISCDLTGCRLVLQPHGHLEIHREGAKHVTSFPVARKESELIAA